jgi:3-oxoacyl-[acyl-carrier protein] reductase
MLDDLTGKVALVTGTSRGIGRAIAIALARAGADVAVNYRSRHQEANETCDEIKRLGRRSIAVEADVSVTADVARLVATVETELGPVAILVNNAGITRPQPVAEITERDWDELIAVNLKSVFLVTQAVLPKMRATRWGRIINLSSVAAQTGGVVGPHYAASKAGILGLTHSYANLLGMEEIHKLETRLIEEWQRRFDIMLEGIGERSGDVDSRNPKQSQSSETAPEKSIFGPANCCSTSTPHNPPTTNVCRAV